MWAYEMCVRVRLCTFVRLRERACERECVFVFVKCCVCMLHARAHAGVCHVWNLRMFIVIVLAVSKGTERCVLVINDTFESSFLVESMLRHQLEKIINGANDITKFFLSVFSVQLQADHGPKSKGTFAKQ